MRWMFLFVLMGALPMYPQSKVIEAYELWRGGQAPAAIQILEPMLNQAPRTLQGAELGVAWGLLASSYQTLEMYDKARHAYQNAMEVLRPIEDARVHYAAVIDDLATMDEALGQMDAARKLCEEALALYQEIGDHTGMAISYSDLAAIHLSQNHISAAQSALDNAFAAERAGGALDDDDLGAMNSVKAALALHAGDAKEAAAAASSAIDCLTRRHGPDYFLLGTSYLLRARAQVKIGDYVQALIDAQHAVGLAEASIGKNSTAYLTARGVVAEVLKASGERAEGARVEKEVRQAMAELHTRQCYQCTIDASGFREAERGSYGFSPDARH